MRDELADAYQSAFTAETPAAAWKSVAQERKHLNDLAKRTRNLAEVTGTDEQELAKRLLNTYWEIRRTAKTEYWRGAPFTPSALTARWDAVVEQLKREHDDGLLDDFEEVGF